MKKRLIAFFAVMTMGSAAFMLSGCSETLSYENANRYSVGSSAISSPITEIEVNWLGGNVNVGYGDVENVTFSEQSKETLMDSLTVHYWLDYTTLKIQYAKSGLKLTNKEVPDKDLTITLPSAFSLTKLEVDSVDANVALNGIMAREVDINNVAGDVTGSLGVVQSLSLELVSGSADLQAEQVTAFELETVSAGVTLTSKTAPTEMEIDNVSADITLVLPNDIVGFSFEVEGINGKFNSEFETTKTGNVYVYGNGQYSYEADNPNGSISVKKGS